MSTILRALQKQKSEQLHTMSAFIEKDSGSLKWKVALFSSSLVIISLLAMVIYLLVKPINEAQKATLFTSPIALMDSEKKEVPAIPKKAEEKLVSKISFDLKPLPEAVQIEKPLAAIDAVQPKQGLDNQEIDAAPKEQLPLVVSAEKPQASVENNKDQIDYSETSADLQQRFENALVMSDIEDKEIVEPTREDSGDGRDIYQMSREFQEKVPAISYDSHMYSSVAKDRWIRINNEDLVEKQFDSSGQIQVVEIQANRTIFRLGRQSFSLESLNDWQGF
ncbi:MAG: general secretion pathway protein B [Psychromonas sp.]|jgi:general secretion pathway protein B|uniref:general secretion pathway protein GspB n=1 Tax=Psychromonas sp. TaxID=1884585 RepID=UPI0039E2EBB5